MFFPGNLPLERNSAKRPSQKTLEKISIPDVVIDDETFWEHIEENRNACQRLMDVYPEHYAVGACQASGFIPSSVIWEQRSIDDLGLFDESLCCTPRQDRQHSTNSSMCGSPSMLMRNSCVDETMLYNETENPPMDLPSWLAAHVEGQNNPSSGGGFTSISSSMGSSDGGLSGDD